MKILITGASGFIGSFIVEEALRRGFETWAAVRKSSSRAYLQDERIHFIELDFASETQMTEQLTGLQFDYIVHAAGVTKCLDKADFHRINTEGTQHLIHVLKALQMPVERFVYISSLSIMGAIREQQNSGFANIMTSPPAREGSEWVCHSPSYWRLWPS